MKIECPSYACLWDGRFLSLASMSPSLGNFWRYVLYRWTHTRINSFLYSGARHNTLLFLTFFFFHLIRDPGDCPYLFIHAVVAALYWWLAWVTCALFNWSSIDAYWGCLRSSTISSCASVNLLAHKAAHKGEQIWGINACIWNGCVERQIHK